MFGQTARILDSAALLAAAGAGGQECEVRWMDRFAFGANGPPPAFSRPRRIEAITELDDGTGPADCTLDFFDFLCFQNAFLAQDPYADCDGDGMFTFFDFLCFQNQFLAGCP